MKQEYYKYLKNLSVYALIIIIGFCIAMVIWPEMLLGSVISTIFCFFLFTNAGFHYLLLKKTFGKESEAFVKTYLTFTGFKFLVYLIGATVMVLTMHQPAIPFAFTFFVLYVLFTGFEVRQLLKNATKKG